MLGGENEDTINDDPIIKSCPINLENIDDSDPIVIQCPSMTTRTLLNMIRRLNLTRKVTKANRSFTPKTLWGDLS
jgi:hypothetical protein